MDRRIESGIIRKRNGSLIVRETIEVIGLVRKLRVNFKCEIFFKYFIFDKYFNLSYLKIELINCRILFN